MRVSSFLKGLEEEAQAGVKKNIDTKNKHSRSLLKCVLANNEQQDCKFL